jgi:membrane protein DedA with SNARE-associated domain
MNQIIQNIVYWVDTSKYILLFIGCIIEGPVLMVASGFIFRLGGFEFWPMYYALVFGDFVADIGWYFVGRFGGRPVIVRWGHLFGITPESVERIQVRFNKYHEKILIISKLTMGFGFALVTLIVAGMLKVPFKRYAMLNLVGGFVWTGLLVLMGYFFGNIYSSITGSEKIVFAVTVFFTWIFILKMANKYLVRANI